MGGNLEHNQHSSVAAEDEVEWTVLMEVHEHMEGI